LNKSKFFFSSGFPPPIYIGLIPGCPLFFIIAFMSPEKASLEGWLRALVKF
jgi:hypothetical protein